jgi:hypothetical protein
VSRTTTGSGGGSVARGATLGTGAGGASVAAGATRAVSVVTVNDSESLGLTPATLPGTSSVTPKNSTSKQCSRTDNA